MRVRVTVKSRLVSLLAVLALSVVTIVAMACGDDEAAPAPAAAPAAAAPPAMPAAAAPTAVPAAAAPTAVPAAAAPTAAPAAVAPTAVPANSLGRDYYLSHASETPKRGGIIRSAGKTTPNTLDPHIIKTGGNFWLEPAFEHLIWIQLTDEPGGKFNLRPGLASSWDWDASDPAKRGTITVNLQKGVTFHDGSPFTAADVKFSLDRVRNEQKAHGRVKLSAITDVQIADDYKLNLIMAKPSPAQLGNMGSASLIISQEHFEAVGEEVFGQDASGTGPVKIKAWVPDLSVEVEPFADYWSYGVDGQKLPYIDGILDRKINDGAVALAEMETNQLDIYNQMEALQIPLVEQDPNLVLYAHHWTGQRRSLIGFNTRKGPFADVRLRKAAQYALDREAQAKAFGPGTKVHRYPYVFPYFFTWDESLPYYEYDPEKARALVREVDPDGEVEVELHSIAREPSPSVAVVIKSFWDAVGIKTTIKESDVSSWLDLNRADNFEVTFWYSFPRGLDPDSDAMRVTRGSSAAYDNIDVPGLQECYERGREEFDQGKRTEIYHECVRILHESAAQYVGFLEVTNFVHRKELKGVGVHLMLFPNMHEAWLDR